MLHILGQHHDLEIQLQNLFIFRFMRLKINTFFLKVKIL